MGGWLFSFETCPGLFGGKFYRKILTSLLQEQDAVERMLEIKLN
jgi:hypothetical protein